MHRKSKNNTPKCKKNVYRKRKPFSDIIEKKEEGNMKKKITLRTIKPYLFLIPIFSLLIIFKYIPFGMAIEKSFFNWNGANMNEFIGFQNFGGFSG